MVRMPEAPLQIPAMPFLEALKAKVNQAVSLVEHVQITPLDFGGRNVHHIWKDTNGLFNLNTWNDINRRVTTPSPGLVKVTDVPFTNTFSSLVEKITFNLSKADEARKNAVELEAQVQVGTIVATYEQIFGPITGEALKVTGQPTKFDYVLYQIRQVWSGALAAKRPLSLMDLKAARHLEDLLPEMPASGQPVLDSFGLWLSKIASVAPLLDAISNARFILRSLRDNLEMPTESNGGMLTIATDGTREIHAGYTIDKAPSEILNDLKNVERKIELSMVARQDDENTITVTTETGSRFTTGLWFFFSMLSATEERRHLFQFKGAGSSTKLTMTFPGWTVVPLRPAAWQVDTLKGWYNTEPVRRAFKNQGHDLTDYQFVIDPGMNLDQDGEFGRLECLLISQCPTIDLVYEEAKYDDFVADLTKTSVKDIQLFGMPVSHSTEVTHETTVRRDDKTGGVRVTFTPSVQAIDTPLLDQTTYVIGGSVIYPAVSE